MPPTTPPSTPSIGANPDGAAMSYAAAGVDVDAGERAVDALRPYAEKANRPEVLGGIGGFAGLFALRSGRYTDPVLAASTDGVGTKVAVAQAVDKHDTIGLDLVAMVVDDIVVCGAKPLVMTDYIACGKVHPERIAAIVSGIAHGCEQAGCALVGGETAEHPGLLAPDDYDVAGAATGVVEADDLLGPHRVAAGDVVIAMASSGLHSNGFSLVRGVLARAGWELERTVPELARPIGAELLEPTRIYARDVLAVAAEHGAGVHAVSHVTGGGLAANLARVLPAGLMATVDRGSWTPPPVFGVLAAAGGLDRRDVEATFNQGVGMVLVVDPAVADAVLVQLSTREVPAWVLGTVGTDPGDGNAVRGTKGVDGGAVRVDGEHPA